MFRIIRKNLEVGKVTIPYKPGTPAPPGFLGAPEIDPEKCTGCGQCISPCPTNALVIQDKRDQDKRELFLSYSACIFCGLCEPACPYEAISFKGKFELAAKRKEELTLEFPFTLSKCKSDPSYVSQEKLPAKEKPSLSQDFAEGDFSSRLSMEEAGMKLKDKITRIFGRSLHIREVDAGSCNGCEVEIVNLSNPIYDAERFGIHFVASPRHADMLLVTGPVTRQMEIALVKTYEAMPSPRLVVACGSCAIGGGIFKGSYAVQGGVDRSLPVDVYIPGCPPPPEAILYGIFVALNKVV
jgi:Ni,Fe-hydrogenase III small subunit/formate hydrogenlyase subunit 6/NADH:ubiquinone oxidoreductase subunit I